MDEPGTRTFYRAAARRYGYPVLMFGVIWAFCGIYAGLLAPLVWSGTNAFVAEPLGLVLTASAIWVLVVGVRFLRIALIAGPSGVRVRGPLHDHTLSWDQIRGFDQGRVGGWTFAGSDNPVVVVAPVSGKPIVGARATGRPGHQGRCPGQARGRAPVRGDRGDAADPAGQGRAQPVGRLSRSSGNMRAAMRPLLTIVGVALSVSVAGCGGSSSRSDAAAKQFVTAVTHDDRAAWCDQIGAGAPGGQQAGGLGPSCSRNARAATCSRSPGAATERP